MDRRIQPHAPSTGRSGGDGRNIVGLCRFSESALGPDNADDGSQAVQLRAGSGRRRNEAARAGQTGPRAARATAVAPSPCGPRRRSSRLDTVQPAREREKASLALYNLRGLAIAFVLMTHASLAYVASAPAQAFPFDRPPYGWQIFPIVDAHRWLGFDVFCAWQDVYLMSFWFFLSGVFTWPSIERDGGSALSGETRLAAGSAASFRRDGADAGRPLSCLPRDARQTRASRAMRANTSPCPSRRAARYGSCGCCWRSRWPPRRCIVFARRTVLRIGDLSRRFESRPARTFVAWAVICAAAYVPLALLFTPWTWSNYGPIAFQLCRPLLYAAYYCAGLGVGTVGLGKGMLRADGVLAQEMADLDGRRRGVACALDGTDGVVPPSWSGGASAFEVRDGRQSMRSPDACSVVFVLAVCLRFGTDRPLAASGDAFR